MQNEKIYHVIAKRLPMGFPINAQKPKAFFTYSGSGIAPANKGGIYDDLRIEDGYTVRVNGFFSQSTPLLSSGRPTVQLFSEGYGTADSAFPNPDPIMMVESAYDTSVSGILEELPRGYLASDAVFTGMISVSYGETSLPAIFMPISIPSFQGHSVAGRSVNWANAVVKPTFLDIVKGVSDGLGGDAYNVELDVQALAVPYIVRKAWMGQAAFGNISLDDTPSDDLSGANKSGYYDLTIAPSAFNGGAMIVNNGHYLPSAVDYGSFDKQALKTRSRGANPYQYYSLLPTDQTSYDGSFFNNFAGTYPTQENHVNGWYPMFQGMILDVNSRAGKEYLSFVDAVYGPYDKAIRGHTFLDSLSVAP
jgi:hypothetical protein